MQIKRIIVICAVLVYNMIIKSKESAKMTFENRFVGLTVKQILVDELGFSKKAITALKARENGILINGKHVTVRAKIAEGDILTINLDDEESNCGKLVPSGALPDIIYEDENVVAVNKPPYMPTHQSQGHFYDTLANSLAYYYSLMSRPFVFRSVNRLDRNTSGIVLVAKNRIASAKLSEQMQRDRIKKTYLAILDGHLPNDEGVIETYIRRREKSIIFREVCNKCDGAKLAVTRYKVLAKSGGLSLVQATPETGRTHQLRVHFSHLGAQILGDDLYGKSSPLISRHALHAYSIRFTNPENSEITELYAPVPEDMRVLIEQYFGKDFT